MLLTSLSKFIAEVWVYFFENYVSRMISAWALHNPCTNMWKHQVSNPSHLSIFFSQSLLSSNLNHSAPTILAIRPSSTVDVLLSLLLITSSIYTFILVSETSSGSLICSNVFIALGKAAIALSASKSALCTLGSLDGSLLKDLVKSSLNAQKTSSQIRL